MAEEVEGWSEDFNEWKRRKYYLDCVVNSESETTSLRGRAGIGVYWACRFGAKHFPHKVKVEISAARGGGVFNPA